MGALTMDPGWSHKNQKFSLSLINCILISGDEAAAQRAMQEALLLETHKDSFDKIRFVLYNLSTLKHVVNTFNTSGGVRLLHPMAQ